jgi:transcriptional regulator with XRE-family HTH domain
MAIGIKDFRKRIGLQTQTELAKLLGIKASNVSEWESGNGFPSYQIIKKLLEKGATIEELFGIEYAKTHNLTEIDPAQQSFLKEIDDIKRSQKEIEKMRLDLNLMEKFIINRLKPNQELDKKDDENRKYDILIEYFEEKEKNKKITELQVITEKADRIKEMRLKVEQATNLMDKIVFQKILAEEERKFLDEYTKEKIEEMLPSYDKAALKVLEESKPQKPMDEG